MKRLMKTIGGDARLIVGLVVLVLDWIIVVGVEASEGGGCADFAAWTGVFVFFFAAIVVFGPIMSMKNEDIKRAIIDLRTESGKTDVVENGTTGSSFGAHGIVLVMIMTVAIIRRVLQ